MMAQVVQYEASALPVSGDVIVCRQGGGAGGKRVPAAEALAIWAAVERWKRGSVQEPMPAGIDAVSPAP